MNVPPPGSTPTNRFVSRDEHQRLKEEVDALQVGALSREERWYRSPSVVVSCMALCFSLATTWFSYQREDAADARAARTELRSILQRLIELPIEQNRVLLENPAQEVILASIYFEEHGLLLEQAESIADRHPGLLSSAEFFALAKSSERASQNSKFQKFLRLAIDRKSDANSHVMALCGLAAYRYRSDPGDGERLFKEAISVWSEYPDTPVEDRRAVLCGTHIAWAQSCVVRSQYAAAREHCEAALNFARSLPDYHPEKQQLTGMAEETKSEIATRQRNQPKTGIVLLNPPRVLKTNVAQVQPEADPKTHR